MRVKKEEEITSETIDSVVEGGMSNKGVDDLNEDMDQDIAMNPVAWYAYWNAN